MINHITDNRNRELNDLFRKSSRCIFNYALLNSIDVIIIDHNDLWRQKVNIGRIITRTSYRFHSIA